MAERGVTVDHAALNRWVVRYAPLIAAKVQARSGSRPNPGGTVHLAEHPAAKDIAIAVHITRHGQRVQGHPPSGPPDTPVSVAFSMHFLPCQRGRKGADQPHFLKGAQPVAIMPVQRINHPRRDRMHLACRQILNLAPARNAVTRLQMGFIFQRHLGPGKDHRVGHGIAHTIPRGQHPAAVPARPGHIMGPTDHLRQTSNDHSAP